jgi:hypothetical protein
MVHGRATGTARTSNESNKNIVTWVAFSSRTIKKTRYDLHTHLGVSCVIWIKKKLSALVVDLVILL